MKVSVNWLREYLDFELPATDELVERIGAQLGAVEEVIDLSGKYQGAVLVKVVECAPLENSDHLNLCFIDDGGVVDGVARRDDGLVQVVCGAPNVAAGLTVVWLPPGSTVPSTYDTDPFVLEARELRGAVSNGMLASPKELALGDSHEGLLIIDGEYQPGASFAETFKLNDQIIDIENKMFTHRPDCFGQLGVAREVAGILGRPFVSPSEYLTPGVVEARDGELKLDVRNDVPELVPRFMAQVFENIAIGPSPIWMQAYLARVGVRPINNVVDITNYFMLLTGQPSHAYDYDKVASLSGGDGAHLVVRHPEKDEQLTLLSGKTITPRSEAIMIATDRQAIGVGGVMGGADTEVDANTKNIILEVATFDMYSVRRTSMAHGLFTDAVTRFNKGQSPLQNDRVMAMIADQLIKDAQAAPATLHDLNGVSDKSAVHAPVRVEAQFVNDRLGLNLTADDMATLLTNVEFAVQISDEALTVTAPFWRTDIEIAEDVVEEIGRLHGFDKLPLVLPHRDITPAPQNPLLKQKAAIRASLTKVGANELLTYSFVHGDLISKAAQKPEQAFKLSNALSPDLQYYRLSALPSLLDKVHGNIKAGHSQFALFELSKAHGTAHLNKDGLPLEFEDLDLVFASKQTQAGAAFYRAKAYLDVLAMDLGLALMYQPFDKDPDDPITDPYDLSRSAQVLVDNQVLGIVGEFKASVRRNFKLPAYSAGFSVSQQRLLQAGGQTASRYRSLPRFPKVEQDICLRVPADTSYKSLFDVVMDTLNNSKPADTTFSVGALDIFQREDDAAHKQITFRVSLVSHERTLTDQEMAKLLQQVAERAGSEVKAEQV